MRHFFPQEFSANSAWLQPSGLHPDAARIVAEAGADISQKCSKQIEELADVKFDYVATVCEEAYESYPVFQEVTLVIRRGFDDPPRIAKGTLTEAGLPTPSRRARDEIREFVQSLPKLLGKACA